MNKRLAPASSPDRRRSNTAGRTPGSFGPERLEPRALLAAVAWDGEAMDGDWHNPLNWVGDVLPAENDDVTIAADSMPDLFIEVGQEVRIASLDLGKSLAVRGSLEVTGSTLVRDTEFFHVAADGEATTANLTLGRGEGGASTAGLWTITGDSTIERRLIITGELRIEGSTRWTTGSISLSGEASRLVIAEGAALAGQFETREVVRITGEGVVEVQGELSAWWSFESDTRKLVISTDADVTGRISVQSGRLQFNGSIVQIESVENERFGGQSIRLMDGTWVAGRNGVLDLGTQIDHNFARIEVRHRAKFTRLGRPEYYRGSPIGPPVLVNRGEVHLSGEGIAGRCAIENKGLILKQGALEKTWYGELINEEDGRLIVDRGQLIVRRSEIPVLNRGLIRIGKVGDNATHARLTVIGADFRQTEPGRLVITRQWRSTQFAPAALVVLQDAYLGGTFEYRVAGTPAGTSTIYRFNPVMAGSVVGDFDRDFVEFDERTTELFYLEDRVNVVARP